MEEVQLKMYAVFSHSNCKFTHVCSTSPLLISPFLYISAYDESYPHTGTVLLPQHAPAIASPSVYFSIPSFSLFLFPHVKIKKLCPPPSPLSVYSYFHMLRSRNCEIDYEKYHPCSVLEMYSKTI
jgi:hypothetical protein